MKYYLTKEGKAELLSRISIDEKNLVLTSRGTGKPYAPIACLARLGVLNEILENSIILPEYNSWEDVEIYPPDNEGQNDKTRRDINGVIIKTK